MKIGAIVVTYNRKALLAECLRALVCQSRPPDEVLVVDNASSDGTAEMVRADWGDRVRLKTLEANLGGAGGFAAGMRWALSLGLDWVWMMDDDAVPTSDALEALAGPMADRREDLVALCSAVIPAEQANGAPAAGIEPIDKALFVGYGVNRRTMEQVGLPREDFFIYTDDTEYCLRIRRAGGEILRVRHSVIHHADWKADSNNRTVWVLGHKVILDPAIPGWKRYYLARNRLLIGREYGLGYLAQSLGKCVLLAGSTAVFSPRDLPLVLRGLGHGLAGISGARVRPTANQGTASS